MNSPIGDRTKVSGPVLEYGADVAPMARLVLGGRFGEEDCSLSHQRLDRFVEAGGQLVETAYSYADGSSEKVIGRWLRAHPGRLGVVDKVGHPAGDGTLDLSLERLRHEAAVSCRRLGVESVDVLLLHRDDPARPLDELADSLCELLRVGYARRIGVANWSPRRLEPLVALLVGRGHRPVVSYQFSLAVPARPIWPGTWHAAQDIRQVAQRYRLPLLAWAGQARGFFAGTSEPTGDGLDDPFDTPDNRAKLRRCQVLAKQRLCRPETVALAWTLYMPDVWPIIGPRSLTELDASIAAASLPLSEETRRWLAWGDAA